MQSARKEVSAKLGWVAADYFDRGDERTEAFCTGAGGAAGGLIGGWAGAQIGARIGGPAGIVVGAGVGAL